MNTPNPDPTSSTFSRRTFLGQSGLLVGGSLLAGASMRGYADETKPAGVATPLQNGEFMLPALPYAFDALAPHIDAKTMEIHHGKHHAGYTKNLNTALAEQPELKKHSITTLLASLDQVDDSIRTAVRNNGGGYYNHALFWETMSPESGKPSEELVKAIDSDLGGMNGLKENLAKAAGSQFGSGWGWVYVTPEGKLAITSTPNQDNPLMKGVTEVLGSPILGIDVWEHAYYLNYQNRRADYIDAWFSVVNWSRDSELYKVAKA